MQVQAKALADASEHASGANSDSPASKAHPITRYEIAGAELSKMKP